MRNISTCVEQILLGLDPKKINEKHLHMRGADLVSFVTFLPSLETSPHALSRFRLYRAGCPPHRNISTCVEQIPLRAALHDEEEKHLHMRGADAGHSASLGRTAETSPHAWSRSCLDSTPRKSTRNISTCVEQMHSQSRRLQIPRKHLHMRGADYPQAACRDV